jgi:hypothetical protein
MEITEGRARVFPDLPPATGLSDCRGLGSRHRDLWPHYLCPPEGLEARPLMSDIIYLCPLGTSTFMRSGLSGSRGPDSLDSRPHEVMDSLDNVLARSPISSLVASFRHRQQSRSYR